MEVAVLQIVMNWKRATTVSLWVLAVIVPGGLWAMAVYLAAKAARKPLARAQQALGQPLNQPLNQSGTAALPR